MGDTGLRRAALGKPPELPETARAERFAQSSIAHLNATPADPPGYLATRGRRGATRGITMECGRKVPHPAEEHQREPEGSPRLPVAGALGSRHCAHRRRGEIAARRASPA